MSTSSAASTVYNPSGIPSTDVIQFLTRITKYISPTFKEVFNYMAETTENKSVTEININDDYNLSFMMTVFGDKYKLRRANEIRDFLNENNFLIPIISNAYEHLSRYFPRSPIFMEIERGILVISVGTELSAEEATSKLYKFDEDWWLDACIDSRARICITVEYQ